MASLTVTPDSTRASFAPGESTDLDSIVADALLAEVQAYESALVAEYDQYGSFGGGY